MDYDYIVDASDLNKEIKFVTGSNSTLLSGELAALLTGRTVEFEISRRTIWHSQLLCDRPGRKSFENWKYE